MSFLSTVVSNVLACTGGEFFLWFPWTRSHSHSLTFTHTHMQKRLITYINFQLIRFLCSSSKRMNQSSLHPSLSLSFPLCFSVCSWSVACIVLYLSRKANICMIRSDALIADIGHGSEMDQRHCTQNDIMAWEDAEDGGRRHHYHLTGLLHFSPEW